MAIDMRLMGLDPGLQHTGWGIIDAEGSRLSYIAGGVIDSRSTSALADRLVEIHDGLRGVIDQWQPLEAAVEETFVNKNPTSTLKPSIRRTW